jgi:hypothetical protein
VAAGLSSRPTITPRRHRTWLRRVTRERQARHGADVGRVVWFDHTSAVDHDAVVTNTVVPATFDTLVLSILFTAQK